MRQGSPSPRVQCFDTGASVAASLDESGGLRPYVENIRSGRGMSRIGLQADTEVSLAPT